MAAIVSEKCKICADRAAWIGLWGNVGLVVFKGSIGFYTGSLAVIADAAHSGGDVLCSIVGLIAIGLGRKPPDETHPYGHGKAEFIAGSFIGLVLLFGAAIIVISSINRLLSRGNQSRPHFLALTAAVVSILGNEMLFRYMICAGNRVNSAALEAQAWDNRADCLSSIPVFFAVLGAQFGFYSLDSGAALLIGLLVGKVGFEQLSKNLHGLMDGPLHSSEVARIKQLAAAVSGVKGIGYLQTRGVGRGYLADLQILVDPEITVDRSNTIAREIKAVLLREIKHLRAITIVSSGVEE